MAKRRGVGRPTYEPTEKDRRWVEMTAACGIIETDIAQVIGIDPKTLRKHFREELDTAAIKANAKVAGALFTAATDGRNMSATIFWCKTRLGWQEVQRHELGGIDGNPMETTIRVVYEDVPAKATAPASRPTSGI